jgi:hypothetical protein
MLALAFLLVAVNGRWWCYHIVKQDGGATVEYTMVHLQESGHILVIIVWRVM